MPARQSDSTSHRSCLAEFTGLNLLLTIPRTYSDPATDATLTGCINPGAGSLTAGSPQLVRSESYLMQVLPKAAVTDLVRTADVGEVVNSCNKRSLALHGTSPLTPYECNKQ